MRPFVFFWIIVLIVDGCVDRFEVPRIENDPVILIDGMITDRPGPYQVTMTYARNITTQLDIVDKVRQANVVLFDNETISETLKEVSPGIYETKNTHGVVGHQYKIRVSLINGSVYESLPETLLPVGKIQRVWYEFDETIRASVRPIPPRPGLNVYIDAVVLPEQAGLVRWRTTGTWENLTFPLNRTIRSVDPRTGVLSDVPDPPKCSGYGFFPCTCCHCWMTNYDPEPVLSDPLFHQQEVKRQFVSFVPAYANVFYNKFHLKVEQMSLSQKSYDFWDDVKTQKHTVSDLFQTPVAKVTGNIITISGKTRVLGYFAASSLRDTSFFITRDAIPYKLPYIDVVKESCLEGNPFATNIKPAFWD
jgi:hypothetical protein